MMFGPGLVAVLVVAAAIAGAAALAGWQRWVAPAPQAIELRERVPEPVAAMAGVWSRHIRKARASGDRAVKDLAAAFADVARDVESSVSRSREIHRRLGAEGGALDATRASRDDLQRIVRTLRAAELARDGARDEITRHAEALRESTREINELALQTRLIALNAGIEANRAGEGGRAFAVVTRELERLARQTEQTAGRMTAQVRVIASTLASLDGRGPADAGVATLEEAERATARVVDRFAEVTARLAEAVERMESEGRAVHRGLSDALVALQFQDRVSQILAHTAKELESLQALLARGEPDAADVERWRASIGREYSTAEELDNLASAAAARPAGLVPQVTFF